MKAIIRLFAAIFLLGALPASAQSPYSRLFVFGDSLVDSGNAFLATGGAAAPLQDGYFLGRFSNGPNFADYLVPQLTGEILFPAFLGGTNFAVGGATAGFIPGAASPSFLEQVALFGSIGEGAIPADALVLVTFGGNDVRRTIGTGGPVSFAAANNALALGLTQLHASGARNFLITGSPDIGNLPRSIADVGAIPGRLEELRFRSQQISALFAGTSSFFGTLTGANVGYFDLFSFEAQVRANPAAFGLPANLNLTDPCQVPGQLFLFQPCGNSLYFDAIHPTTIAHFAIASALRSQAIGSPTAAIPEPATWLVLILGFAVIGARLRSRRPRPAMARAA